MVKGVGEPPTPTAHSLQVEGAQGVTRARTLEKCVICYGSNIIFSTEFGMLICIHYD